MFDPINPRPKEMLTTQVAFLVDKETGCVLEGVVTGRIGSRCDAVEYTLATYALHGPDGTVTVDEDLPAGARRTISGIAWNQLFESRDDAYMAAHTEIQRVVREYANGIKDKTDFVLFPLTHDLRREDMEGICLRAAYKRAAKRILRQDISHPEHWPWQGIA